MGSYRSDFPIFATHPGLIYLDSAASAQKPAAMIEVISHFYQSGYANVHRGVYPLAVESDQAFWEARQTVAHFISAAPQEVIFTRNATEGLNLLASSLGEGLKEGDEIVLSSTEHHANLVPWQQLAFKKGLVLKFVKHSETGEIDLADLESLVTSRTRIITLSHCSNVLGRILPALEIKKIIERQGSEIFFILDASQSAAHIPLSVSELGCDFLVFSGHKVYGPSGIGVLWGREGLLKTLPPYQTGGDMIRTVDLESSTWNDLPWKFEAGTPNIEGAIGLAASLRYLMDKGMDTLCQHTIELATLLRRELEEVEGVTIIGDPHPESGLVSFSAEDVHPHDLADLLGQRRVCVRAGHHCAAPLHKELGLTASTRASVALYNTAEDIYAFATILREALADLHA